MGIKQILKHNFSRHAQRYDAHASVQKAIGVRLVERLGADSFTRILDVGCGTGDYTQLLHERYPAARITGIDLSPEMIEEAHRKLGRRGIEFVVGDAETIAFEAPFDLITSNACLHWFVDLDVAIAGYAAALTEDGCLAFSSQGPRTFWELADCLDAVAPTHSTISARAFPDQHDLEVTLSRHFPVVSVVEEIMTETYPSLLALLNTIKYTGTRGAGLTGATLSRPRLKELEQAYVDRIGAIEATYQTFYCLARKKENAQR